MGIFDKLFQFEDFKDYFKYGKHVVGLSLDLIEQGKFEELEEKIKRNINQKFGDVFYDIKDILIGAAEELGISLFFTSHLLRASDIYKYLGDTKKSEELIKLYNEVKRNQLEYQLECNNMFT